MASIRYLKKELSKLKNELLNELDIYKEFHPKTDEKLIQRIRLNIESEYKKIINKIQHPDKKGTKAYFNAIIKDIREKFISSLDELDQNK